MTEGSVAMPKPPEMPEEVKAVLDELLGPEPRWLFTVMTVVALVGA